MTIKITNAVCRWSAPLVLVLGLAVAPALAQAPAATPQTQTPASSNDTFSKAQIEQLVAPIALYPDSLLSQMLMASTYPLEVVEAARWSNNNPGVTGEALQNAMQAQSWDPSVKALTAVPQTLQMMSDKLDWTQQLGDAFLAQQQDVMTAVQTLRAQARAAGYLQSTPQQAVATEPPPAGAVASSVSQPIVIRPADPDIYAVPVYNPAVVYGTWPYPAYPPFYWSPPGFVASNVVSFAAGIGVGTAIWAGCDWWRHNVVINVNRYNFFNRRTNINITNNTWIHDPAHRDGVPYRNAAVARRFHQDNEPAMRRAEETRMEAQQGNLFRNQPVHLRNDNARRDQGNRTGQLHSGNSDRRNGNVRGNRGGPPARWADAPRRDFAVSARGGHRRTMRARAQSFRPARSFHPQRHAMRGGFQPHGGGRRR
jgi:hypothetical protein